MMIERLTPEQEQLMSVYREEWLNKIFKYELYNSVTLESATKAMQRLYEISGLKKPKVYLVDSPKACKELARKISGSEDNLDFSGYGNSSDFGWVAFYKFFKDEVGVTGYTPLFEEYIDICQQSFMSIQLEGHCIVSRYPKSIHRDNDNEMHNINGYAVEFADGYGQHYVHGRFIEKEVFDSIVDVASARTRFDMTDNEDIRGIVSTIVMERWGNEGLMDMLNAYLVEEETFNHENGYSETMSLYKTKSRYEFATDRHGNRNQPLAWLRQVCPSTGTTYLISTCPTFDNVVDCAKWHRPSFVPANHKYRWNSAN